MTTPILKITEAANGQVDQYLTYNEALRALESSANNFYVVDMSAGDVTLTDTANADPALNYIFSRNQLFRTSGNTVARVLTVPQSKRLFVVQNGGTFALTVKRGTSEISVATAGSGIFYCDGTANGLVAVVNAGGYVSGPSSSADNEIALFDGATGKMIKRGAVVGTAASANMTTSSTDKTANSALKVGDGGLLVPIVLVGPNLNTRRPTGFYYAQAPANNPPGTSSGWLLQQDISDAYNTHFYVDAATGDFYHRTLSNSVQRPWREVWDTGNTSSNVQTMLNAANNAAIRSAISASSLPSYTLGTVPSAAANTNLLIVITDLTGGREPCYSDGANWLRCSDKTIAS